MMLDEYYDGKRKWVDPRDGCERPLEEVDSHGETPLRIACRQGLERVVLRLLEIEGVRWDGADRASQTPLVAACEKGMVKVCLRLLEGEKDDKTGKWKLKVNPPRSCFVWDHEKAKAKQTTIMEIAVEKELWDVVKRLKEVGVEDKEVDEEDEEEEEEQDEEEDEEDEEDEEEEEESMSSDDYWHDLLESSGEEKEDDEDEEQRKKGMKRGREDEEGDDVEK